MVVWPETADRIWNRVKEHMPPGAAGINARFRFFRYGPETVYRRGAGPIAHVICPLFAPRVKGWLHRGFTEDVCTGTVVKTWRVDVSVRGRPRRVPGAQAARGWLVARRCAHTRGRVPDGRQRGEAEVEADASRVSQRGVPGRRHHVLHGRVDLGWVGSGFCFDLVWVWVLIWFGFDLGCIM